jgi:hypothetical protein
MVKTPSFNRLIVRAVLRQVSPMVIRLVSVSDQMPLHEFHDVFRTILGWNGDLGYIVRVHAQEINSFRRKTRSKALHEFKLHRQEKFLYVCDTLHMWEWDIRVLGVRNHLQLTAERIEQELGQERQLNRFEGSEQEWERQPLPDGPITVGIDGGYVRAAHKQGWFEVIAGKSVVAFRRDDEGEVPSRSVSGSFKPTTRNRDGDCGS